MNENGFSLKKKKKKKKADDTSQKLIRDDIALVENTSTRVEYQQHRLNRIAGGIGLHVNAEKMENMCFNKKRRHLHYKWWFYEIRGNVNVPGKQCLMN